MDPTVVPLANLRISLAEFTAGWQAAESFLTDHRNDWHAIGVVTTSRWLATATPYSPVLDRHTPADEKMIAIEYIAADTYKIQRPEWVAERGRWIEAVIATLTWAWRGMAPAPISTDQ